MLAALFLFVAFLIYSVFYAGMEYPALDISKFDSYAKVVVPGSGTYRIDIPKTLLTEAEANTLYVGTLYNGRMVVLPYSVINGSSYYHLFFYTPREGNHSVYIFLHPEDNSTMSTSLTNVFEPREVLYIDLNKAHAGNPVYVIDRVSARYSPDRNQLLVVLYEKANGAPWGAQFYLYVLDPSDFNIIHEFHTAPRSDTKQYITSLRGVDVQPDADKYFVGFYYIYTDGTYDHYAYNGDYMIDCSSGSCSAIHYVRLSTYYYGTRVVTAIPAIDIYPPANFRYGKWTAERLGVVRVVSQSKTSPPRDAAFADFSVNTSVDTRENMPVDSWCSNRWCFYTVYTTHGIDAYSTVPRYVLAKHMFSYSDSLLARVIYDPRAPSDYSSYRSLLGQKYHDNTIYYDGYRIENDTVYKDPDSVGIFVHYKYLGAKKMYLEGKAYSLPGYPAVASDGNYFYSVLVSDDKSTARVLKWTYDYHELGEVNLSFEPISLGTVILDDRPQLYTYLKLTGTVSVDTPGTYTLSVFVDGNLVYEENMYIDGTTTFTAEAPVSVPFDSNAVVTVTVHDSDMVYAFVEQNVRFYPAVLENLPSSLTVYVGRSNQITVTYLSSPDDNTEVVFDFNGDATRVQPSCNEYNYYAICSATYDFAPPSAGQFDVSVSVLVYHDANTYAVPLGTVSLSAVYPPSGGGATEYSPISIEGNVPSELGQATPSQLSTVPVSPTSVSIAIVVLFLVFYLVYRYTTTK